MVVFSEVKMIEIKNCHKGEKKDRNMKTLLLWLILISHTYAYVDESTLTSLQRSDHWNTFRIVISHTADECFYIETQLNDTIQVIYQVLKGGDYYIKATITDPTGNVVFTQADGAFGRYSEEQSKIPGTYQMCFRNERYFTTKILYIGVLAVSIDRLLESAVKAIQKERNNETVVVDEFSKRAMKTLSGMSSTLYQLTAHQTIAHIHHTHDMYAVQANAAYVQKWAICQIVTMIVCSIIQAFSIRRLFKSTIPKKTLSSKKSNPVFQSQTSDYLIIAN